MGLYAKDPCLEPDKVSCRGALSSSRHAHVMPSLHPLRGMAQQQLCANTPLCYAHLTGCCMTWLGGERCSEQEAKAEPAEHRIATVSGRSSPWRADCPRRGCQPQVAVQAFGRACRNGT